MSIARQIRDELQATGCKPVYVETRSGMIARIDSYNYTGSESFGDEPYFAGECNGEDTWGPEGNYHPDSHESIYDLVKIVRGDGLEPTNELHFL